MTTGIRKPLLLAVAACVLALGACSHRDNLTPTPISPTPSAGPSASGQPSASPSASPSSSPTAIPSGAPGTIPLTIVNTAGSPIQPSSNINVYVYGQDDSTGAWEGANSDGSTYALPNVGMVVKPIPWSGGNANTETIFVPITLIGGRIYIVDGGGPGAIKEPTFEIQTAGTGPTAPAPWANDGSQDVYFDDVEYAEGKTLGNINFDLSQTDALGLDLEVVANEAGGGTTSPIGFRAGAMTAFSSALQALPSPNPWSRLTNQMPYHIINPQHGSPNFFLSSTFLDSAIMTAWDTYRNGNWMEITANSLAPTDFGAQALYGTVDSNGDFVWYTAPDTASTKIGTIENPQTFANANSGTATDSVTMQVLAQNHVFGDFKPSNAQYPNLGPAVGNRLSGALNSGVMAPTATPSAGAPLTVQPICDLGARFPGPTVAPYENQFAATLHLIANTYAYVQGAAYGYPYDDLCGTSTDTTATGITQMTITINPS